MKGVRGPAGGHWIDSFHGNSLPWGEEEVLLSPLGNRQRMETFLRHFKCWSVELGLQGAAMGH